MKIIYTAVIAALLLTSCGGGSGSSSNSSSSSPTTTSILVTNTDGGKTDVSGTWSTLCRVGAPFDTKTIDEFSGSSYKQTRYNYTSTDGSCASGETITGSITTTLGTQTELTAAGWIDNSNAFIAAPTAQNGTTTLPATPSATVYLVTVTAVSGTYDTIDKIMIGDQDNIAAVVDATNANKIVAYDFYHNGTAYIADTTTPSYKQ